MSRKRITPEQLIDLAIDALRHDLTAELSGPGRYTAAMAVRALEIARREIATDAVLPEWALLDEIYDDGEGSPAELARDIRAGIVNERTRPTLHADLRRLVAAELAIRNPAKIGG
jgi:Domain of unknown function (DUF6285)